MLEHGFHVVALEPNAAVWPLIARSEGLIQAQDAKDFVRCELVIESITENLSAKEALYEELEQHVGPSVPIASNTSGFPITLLQKQRRYPNRFAGMHWASPANATRFLEIIRGDLTDDRTIKQVEALATELGKEPATVRDVPGFVANRIAYAMYREAIHLVEEGVADVPTIDLLCRHSLGLWAAFCGPFRWMDITGGPALYATAMDTIVPSLSNEAETPRTMQQMKKDDRRGTQNGQGFYTYAPGDDAEWQKKLREHAMRLWASDQK